ncbi:MAG: preprotein translocase subunit SecE [Oceanicaulis sp.]
MARNTKTRQPAKTGASGKAGASSNAAASAPARKKTTNPIKFLGEVRQEGRKVTWTSRRETIISTIMVLVMATIAAIFFFAVDSLIGWIINFLLSFGAS